MNGQMTAHIGENTKKPNSHEWSGFKKPKADKQGARHERKDTRQFLQNLRNGDLGDDDE